MITMIPRSKLEPHPDNPRKELGDLEDLAASIKARGVLQNLTVVPSPGDQEKYRVIIGHRRLAAAELAGLEELPCSVEDMDMATQIATMLAENMQRNDLTLCDQVSGVQTMMDLGEDVKAIADKTGLSSTTIRRRAKLGELNQQKMKEAETRGATLMDLIAIANLSNAENREYVLEVAGTYNFANRLSEVKAREKTEVEFEKVRPQIEAWAKIIDSDEWAKLIKRTAYVRSVTIGAKDADYTKPAEANHTGEYVFVYRNSAYATVYEIMEDDDPSYDDPKREERERNRQIKQMRMDACDEMKKRAYDLRLSFMKDFHPGKEHIDVIMDLADYALLEIRYDVIKDEDRNSILRERGNPTIMYKLAVDAWLMVESKYGCLSYDDGNGKYKDDERLNMIYSALVAFGYQMSDDELAWNNGTHKCFTGPFYIDEEGDGE